MPVSREEFEREEIDLASPILHFLRNNSDFAFTAEELLQMLASQGRPLSREGLLETLLKLTAQGKTEVKSLGEMQYYIFKKPKMGFVR